MTKRLFLCTHQLAEVNHCHFFSPNSSGSKTLKHSINIKIFQMGQSSLQNVNFFREFKNDHQNVLGGLLSFHSK